MTETPIQRLLYVSRITAKAAGPLPSTMEDILLESHARNDALRVTGFLWSDGAYFAQVLEGPFENVDAIFASILKDDRHKEIDVRFYDEVGERLFARWAMCGMTLSDLDERLIEGGVNGGRLLASATGEILGMLRKLYEVNGEALAAQHRRIAAAAAG